MRPFTVAVLLFFSVAAGCAQEEADSLLSSCDWAEESQEYILRLQPHGSFEEDAGAAFTRSSRYLLGRWAYVDSTATLTLSVDYFMGKSMVDGRYRDGRDFYLDYDVVELSDSTLRLQDQLTGKFRSFTSRPTGTDPDAAERRKPQPALKPDFSLPKLPGGRGG